MSEHRQIALTVSLVFFVIAAPAISLSPSDPEARCREVITHRGTLRAERTPDEATREAELATCRESITERQARCAMDARSLDAFERCFM